MIIGADVTSNEIVYGLKGLDAAIAFEKDRGTLAVSTVVDCVLSVSVTHESLVPLARDEVHRSIVAAGELENLAVFAFTEADTRRLVTEVLAPAIGCDRSLLTIFGVNGNYGRHYSFCKAIAALWQTVVDPGIDRAFKFDLDQVFPQEHLLAETGRSALEFLTMGSQWGASGVDSERRQVNLGMCAGALVNQSDVGRGLFTPDIECPTSPPSLPDLIFRKAVPQALSTEAEMMDRGGDHPGAVRNGSMSQVAPQGSRSTPSSATDPHTVVHRTGRGPGVSAVCPRWTPATTTHRPHPGPLRATRQNIGCTRRHKVSSDRHE